VADFEAVVMQLLEVQKVRLEQEIVQAKEKLRQLSLDSCQDLSTIRQLQEQLERNWQLIGMIDEHLGPSAKVTNLRK